ncbi:MAG: GTP cyclohydrolase, FolE2/MptA family, partial [Verrucomicrobiia bacterium]
HPDVTWFKVEAENYESIHNHNAYACIERENYHPHTKPKKGEVA